MTAVLDTPPVFALEIRAAGTDSPRRARRWLAWVLETAGVQQGTLDAALLATSELVTNSVTHTDCARILVAAEVTRAGVRLLVHDNAAPLDDERTSVPVDTPDDLAEHGRGLVIVQALAEEFDITTDAHGTTVSALIRGIR